MQSHYGARFTREMGCTEAEWLGWLPAAIGECAWQRDGQRVLVVFNNAEHAVTHLVSNLDDGDYTEALSGRRYAAHDGELTLEIPAKWAAVLPLAP